MEGGKIHTQKIIKQNINECRVDGDTTESENCESTQKRFVGQRL